MYPTYYLLEFALLPNSKIVCLKKGTIPPIKIERPLALKVYSVLCSKLIISHFMRLVNMFDEIYIITFREVEKSLPCVRGGGTACRDGGVVKSWIYIKTIPQPPSASAPFTQGSLFMFIYGSSIFLTSTAFESTNTKYGIPLSRYAVFLQNCPLEWRPKGQCH